MKRVVLLAVAMALLGCPKTPEHDDEVTKPDEVVDAASPPPSSSSAPPIDEEKPGECHDGVYRPYEDLVGIASVGVARPTLRVELSSWKGIADPARQAKHTCDVVAAFEVCFDAVDRSVVTLGASSTLTLTIDREGKVLEASVVGPFGGAPFTTCMQEATKGLIYAGATKDRGTMQLAFEYARRPRFAVKIIEVAIDVTAGSFPPEVVKRMVRRNYPKMRECYERALLKDATVKGTIVTTFVIDATGAARGVKITGGTMHDAATTSCILGVFVGMMFPKPESGSVSVKYDLDFENAPP